MNPVETVSGKRIWWAAVIFAALYARANALSGGDGFVITEGFPLSHWVLGDGGTLMRFRWSLFAINMGVGVVALFSLVRPREHPFTTRQLVCFIVGTGFAAGYAWVNNASLPPWYISGFPIFYEIFPELSLPIVAINYGIGVFCLHRIYQAFGPVNEVSYSPSALWKWCFNLTITLLWARLNSPWVLWGMGQGGYPLTYIQWCPGEGEYCQFIGGAVLMDSLAGIALIRTLNRHLRSPSLLVAGTTVSLWIWANLGNWDRRDPLYLLPTLQKYSFGFPFPFVNSFEEISYTALAANAAIGVIVVLVVMRLFGRKSGPST